MASKLEKYIPVIVFVLPLAVYLHTLAGSIAAGDNTEMVTAAITLGIPHHPSFPVNTFLGYIAAQLPWTSNVVMRVNALAAVVQAATVLVTYFTLLEMFKLVEQGIDKRGDRNVWLTAVHKLAAMTGSLFLAFSLIFWRFAVRFEVFALNNLIVMLLLWLGMRMGRGYDLLQGKFKQWQVKVENRIKELWLIAGILLGLGFSHHQTAVMVVPTMWVLLGRSWKKPVTDVSAITRLIIGGLLGILPFFIIIWMGMRNPPMNWGDVNGLGGAVNALFRKDLGYVRAYLPDSNVMQGWWGLKQVAYYMQSIVRDFTLIGVGLILLGVNYLWKNGRKIFYALIIGVIVSGPIFLMYANFQLASSFNQATVRRFHMMPNLFLIYILGFGVLVVLEWLFRLLSIKGQVNKLAIKLGIIYVSVSFMVPLLMNYSLSNFQPYSIMQVYAKEAFARTEENALVLLSGDVANMAADYYQMVMNKKADERIIFTPGQFHLDWFLPQLLHRHPKLVIPDPLPGKRFTTASQVVEANYDQYPIYVNPDLVIHDADLQKNYQLIPRHYLFLIQKPEVEVENKEEVDEGTTKEQPEDLETLGIPEQEQEDPDLVILKAENDYLWSQIDLEEIKRIRKNTPMFEEVIVFDFTRHFYNTGNYYEEREKYMDAVREYKRVLEIDPYFKDALAGLGRVYGFRMEQPDYYLAIDYLRKYQSVLQPREEQLGNQAESMIQDLQKQAEEARKKAEEEGEEEGE